MDINLNFNESGLSNNRKFDYVKNDLNCLKSKRLSINNYRVYN